MQKMDLDRFLYEGEIELRNEQYNIAYEFLCNETSMFTVADRRVGKSYLSCVLARLGVFVIVPDQSRRTYLQGMYAGIFKDEGRPPTNIMAWSRSNVCGHCMEHAVFDEFYSLSPVEQENALSAIYPTVQKSMLILGTPGPYERTRALNECNGIPDEVKQHIKEWRYFGYKYVLKPFLDPTTFNPLGALCQIRSKSTSVADQTSKMDGLISIDMTIPL